MAGRIVVRQLWILWMGLALLASAGMAQGRLEKYRSKFERETDPVNKARAVPKLGDALLDLVSTQIRKGDVAAAQTTLEEYRDVVLQAHEGLKASGINAEKKSTGFKQLEIHIRRSLHRLEDLIVAVPLEARKPFEEVRGQLEQVDRDLLEMLFPRRPGHKVPKGG